MRMKKSDIKNILYEILITTLILLIGVPLYMIFAKYVIWMLGFFGFN
jgi:hypothetical protein